MKILPSLLICCIIGIQAEEKPFSYNITFLEITSPETVIGKWSLSDKWSGFMGVTIEFTQDEYKYWFYSDVKTDNETVYPIKGKWSLVKGVITLQAPNDVHLYSKEWMMVKSDENAGLLSPDDIKVLMWHKRDPGSRMIYKIPNK